MKIYKATQTPGFFDVELRVQWLETVIDSESFRPLSGRARCLRRGATNPPSSREPMLTPITFRRSLPLLAALLVVATALATSPARAAETIWIEAENLQGVHGYCFPDMDQQTAGHWALSGPGIAPEWTQGGESEWLSIACAPDDATATASITVDVPEAGEWRLWVRYRDWRGQTEIFAVRLEQTGAGAQEVEFGQKPVVDDNDELKLYWKWAFGWDQRPVKLTKGPAKLTLLAKVAQPGHRQVDAICLVW